MSDEVSYMVRNNRPPVAAITHVEDGGEILSVLVRIIRNMAGFTREEVCAMLSHLDNGYRIHLEKAFTGRRNWPAMSGPPYETSLDAHTAMRVLAHVFVQRDEEFEAIKPYVQMVPPKSWAPSRPYVRKTGGA